MAVDVIARSIASGRVPITAYDMAVAGGYTGTKEQFEADMGNSGTNATNAANSAAAAAASAAEASAIADDIAQYKTDTMTAPANITAGEYILAAGTLYVATANIASGATLTPNGNVTQVTVGEELTKVIASDAQKADADGTSPNLTAGNALQLVSTVGIEDQIPYNFRTSGGSADIGDRETDMIVGGTLAWNQIVAQGDMTDATKWTKTNCTLSCADNVGTFVRTDLTQTGRIMASQGGGIYNNQPYKADHKVLICADLKADALTSGSIALRYKAADVASIAPNGYTAGTWKYTATIKSWDTGSNITYVQVFDYRTADEGEGLNKVYVKNVMIFDLTQMFGTTIADYIYSLEQANAGDGVAWFRKLFPNDYYAYDAGTLRSVQTSAHKMIGFNAWDEILESGGIDVTTGANKSDSGYLRSKNFIPVLPNTTYYYKAPPTSLYARIYQYDASGNLVSYYSGGSWLNATFTTTENTYYLRFTVAKANYGDTYNHDICINLSWDGERDGEYEAYTEHSYPLDDSLTLRGVPTLDENNKLRYDGDTYASDGAVTRRCAEQTFVGASGESWSIYQFATEMPRYAFFIQPAIPRNKSLPNTELVASGVEVNASAAADSGAAATTISARFGANAYTFYISIPRSQFSGQTLQEVVAEFKTWLASNPVSITYERETYVTETADPYTGIQVVSDWGTEEYTDSAVIAGLRDVAIPVGHETLYQSNLRSKLEMAPNSPSSGDGLYAVRQTNGANAYELLVFPDELPPYPSADGTFVLKVTVADGTPTLSWVSE